MRQKKIVIVTLLLVTIVGIVVISNGRGIRVAYHRYQMQRNYDATFSAEADLGSGFRGFSLGSSFTAFEYHRDALVRLGEVDENKYFLNHLVPGTKQRSHFWGILCTAECPKNIYIVGERDEVGAPWPMTVWCWPSETALWNDYIAARDTEHYAEQFMSKEASSNESDAGSETTSPSEQSEN